MRAWYAMLALHMKETAENSRNIKSFVPEPDVLRMLERATVDDGVKLGHIVNNACREWLTKKGYARKKEMAEARS